jgi:hypothetical protein
MPVITDAEEEQFEKRLAMVKVPCKPSEKKRWVRAIGRGEVARKARELLNQFVNGGGK